MNYTEFLESKKHTSINYGIDYSFMPDKMFDFQKYVAEYIIKKGRAADFMDTGLGKTIIELTAAVNYIRHTNKPVLIITPLAVAFQFIKEAEKFGIDDIMYSKDGKYHTKIVICNYERLDKFTATDFDCVILDESSILKNFDGAIKAHITAFLKKIKYRYLFTRSLQNQARRERRKVEGIGLSLILHFHCQCSPKLAEKLHPLQLSGSLSTVIVPRIFMVKKVCPVQ